VPKKLVLAVIDGLTPAMLERALGEGRLPALSFLREAGSYVRGTTTFPATYIKRSSIKDENQSCFQN
jgi:predicted AlkP superfamily pyrophosphatase or phosphodiesterase